eukprot:SAG31_NODE_1203_length_9413_cov_4.778076_4_plen_138_part_00
MKHGNILHFLLRNGCPSLTTELTDAEIFPPEIWKSCDVAAAEVAAADSQFIGSQTLKKVVKEEETESGSVSLRHPHSLPLPTLLIALCPLLLGRMITCSEKFQIVISSTFGFDDYKEFLDGASTVPWDDCMVFEVEE